jgi:glycosyltransferase involved in cell wall biosynthesis
MRRLLYVSPYFPPQSRVGALRPLKFVRHLPDQGWEPVVLCDLRRGDPIDADLLAAIPASTTVIREYGRRAARNERTLGEHGPDIPHAVAAGRRILARHPCAAILVNADPYAATLVGRKLALHGGLPLVLDFRDPWAPCELRRPMRPPLQRLVTDRLERMAVQAASRVILNTDAARDAYVEHYRDLPSTRFVTIRNHSDPELIASTPAPAPAAFTLLLLGNLRRFVEGDVLLQALSELRRRGHSPARVRLRVVGRVPEAVWSQARQLEVADLLEVEPPIPYRQIGGVMQSADVLVAISHAGRQRIPAKVYDYLTTSRPILVATDNPELQQLLREAGGAVVCSLADGGAIADAVGREIEQGRQRSVERRPVGTDSATATARLAQVLDAAVAS